MFLSDVAKASQETNGIFFLPQGGIEKYPGSKNKLVPCDIRREGFRRAGLTWEERPDGTVQLFCKEYPHMLTAISAWVKADKKRKLSFEDVVLRTADEQRTVLETVHKMALQAKLKPQYPDYYWNTSIDYKYKTKRALRIQPGIVLRNNQWQVATLVRLWGSPGSAKISLSISTVTLITVVLVILNILKVMMFFKLYLAGESACVLAPAVSFTILQHKICRIYKN
jgi:hypothetical protein